jgi:Raf kinase inhibitor-like YbhB/YbcL family protein
MADRSRRSDGFPGRLTVELWRFVGPGAAQSTTAPPRGILAGVFRAARPVLLAAALGLVAGCGGNKASEPLPEAPAGIILESPAFSPGGQIPVRYTCDGEDVSPPLRWSGIPVRARSLAMLMEDEDAKGFAHWTVLNIPRHADRLAEGRTPPGAIETENSFGDKRYGGPCPPDDDPPHHYRFALYALSKRLVLGGKASPDDVRDAVGETALARGELTGTFGR